MKFEWIIVILIIAIASCNSRKDISVKENMTNLEIKGYIFETSQGKLRLILVAKSSSGTMVVKLQSSGYILSYANPKRSRILDSIVCHAIGCNVTTEKWTVICDRQSSGYRCQSDLPSSIATTITIGDEEIEKDVIVDLLPSRPPPEVIPLIE